MATYIKVLCKCGKCRKRYTAWWPKDDESNPPCSFCFPPEPWAPTTFAIHNPHRAKAMKIAMEVAEHQGFTDMKDNLREGDTAVKLTPKQSQMAEQSEALSAHMMNPGGVTPRQKSMLQNFWGGSSRPGIGVPNTNTLLAGARTGAQAAKSEGLNPLSILQGGIKHNKIVAGSGARR